MDSIFKILVLPCLFDNMASKVEYRFPLSFKRQSNLHFWPLFDEKLWISVSNGRSPWKKTGAKFSTDHWFAFETSIRSYTDVSKTIERNRESWYTLVYLVYHVYSSSQQLCKFLGTKDGFFLGTLTWPLFHCFGTPIWPPGRHVKTIYSCSLSIPHTPCIL